MPSDGPDLASAPNTFTIANSTVTPTVLVIAVGERVVFVNADDVDHDMSSDQHPAHLECPAINQAGYLRPGESRETGNFVRAETVRFSRPSRCRGGFADRQDHRGRIVPVLTQECFRLLFLSVQRPANGCRAFAWPGGSAEYDQQPCWYTPC